MVKKDKKTEELNNLKAQNIELENNYRRVLADYQNQERRHKEQQTQMISMASGVLIEKLLLPIDSLEIAQSHLKDKGLEMILNQLFSTLKAEGLEPIKSDNEEFDPLTMDCSEIIPGEKNKVIETVVKGYTLSGKVLRPAKVKVGSGSVLRVPEPNQ